jgi:hypothetical protein
MIRSFPPHPNPLPPGERVGHSSPQQSWGVFWHILIKEVSKRKIIYLTINKFFKKIRHQISDILLGNERLWSENEEHKESKKN